MYPYCATGADVLIAGPDNLVKPPTCKLHIAEIRTCKPRSVFLHQRCHTGPAPWPLQVALNQVRSVRHHRAENRALKPQLLRCHAVHSAKLTAVAIYLDGKWQSDGIANLPKLVHVHVSKFVPSFHYLSP